MEGRTHAFETASNDLRRHLALGSPAPAPRRAWVPPPPQSPAKRSPWAYSSLPPAWPKPSARPFGFSSSGSPSRPPLSTERPFSANSPDAFHLPALHTSSFSE